MSDIELQEWLEKEGFALYSLDRKYVICKIQDIVEYILALRERIAELENTITVIGGRDE